MRPSLPDPADGVFETMLVAGERPVELVRHVGRLYASAGELYPESRPDRLGDLALAGARGVALGRLRLSIAPNGCGRLRSDVLVAPVQHAAVFPGWDGAVRLHRLVVAGGLGAHKWADRRLLSRRRAPRRRRRSWSMRTRPCSRRRAPTSSWSRTGGSPRPPADGRLLPGVTRRRVLELAAVREEPIPLARLLAADEVFLSGSVRGIEPVLAYEQVRVWREGPVAAAVAAALRESWEVDP